MNWCLVQFTIRPFITESRETKYEKKSKEEAHHKLQLCFFHFIYKRDTTFELIVKHEIKFIYRFFVLTLVSK